MSAVNDRIKRIPPRIINIKRITFFDISPPLHIDVPIHNLSCYKPAYLSITILITILPCYFRLKDRNYALHILVLISRMQKGLISQFRTLGNEMDSMKITIVFDNTPPVVNGLIADWGFAALVEVDGGKKILFDTGANGEILLSNMAILGIDPSTIDEVFISHAHHDHVGGLQLFLQKNNAVKLWVPPSMHMIRNAKDISVVHGPVEMQKGIYSTGELDGIEQAMVVETSKGLVLLVGCSHPQMKTILGTASQFGTVYGIVGGLHSTNPLDLKGLGLICATHCTRQKSRIKALYPQAYIPGGAGRVIEVD